MIILAINKYPNTDSIGPVIPIINLAVTGSKSAKTKLPCSMPLPGKIALGILLDLFFQHLRLGSFPYRSHRQYYDKCEAVSAEEEYKDLICRLPHWRALVRGTSTED